MSAACSSCYGSDYGVDEKACPCGCRPAGANAGPSLGDYPMDRAIKALPLPQYPTAPPVAAGSVDTVAFRIALAVAESTDGAEAFNDLIAHIDAWGAQQREAGRREGALVSLNNYDAACDEYRKKIAALTERAEKAEAELESWVHTNRIDELQRSYNAVMDRVKELQEALDVAMLVVSLHAQ